jgi:hypothetical protein
VAGSSANRPAATTSMATGASRARPAPIAATSGPTSTAPAMREAWSPTASQVLPPASWPGGQQPRYQRARPGVADRQGRAAEPAEYQHQHQREPPGPGPGGQRGRAAHPQQRLANHHRFRAESVDPAAAQPAAGQRGQPQRHHDGRGPDPRPPLRAGDPQHGEQHERVSAEVEHHRRGQRVHRPRQPGPGQRAPGRLGPGRRGASHRSRAFGAVPVTSGRTGSPGSRPRTRASHRSGRPGRPRPVAGPVCSAPRPAARPAGPAGSGSGPR